MKTSRKVSVAFAAFAALTLPLWLLWSLSTPLWLLWLLSTRLWLLWLQSGWGFGRRGGATPAKENLL